MRSLTRMVRALLFFESAMYSALTPVLPHYARLLHASGPAIGLLAAGYPAGLIPGSVIGGWLAGRIGVRRTAVAGLVGFGIAIALFGVSGALVALDGLRVAQGAFCGLIWGGGLTWVIAAAPPARRGAVIGDVLAAATLGTLLGPVLGTLAISAGTGPVFAAVGAASLALAVWARRHPEPIERPTASRILGQLREVLGAGGFGLGAWTVGLGAMFYGATAALMPLRLARLHAPGWEIGLVFILASALSTALSPLVGRSADRRGPVATMAIGLALGVPLVAALALPAHAWLLGALLVIALGVPMTAGIIPAVSLMTEATERAGVTLLLATTMVNLAYATGETIGAPAAAGLSASGGRALPLLLLAGLLGLTLLVLRRGRRRGAARAAAADPAGALAPPPAIHTARGGLPTPAERGACRGDRRGGDRADRPSPVRLGTQAPPLRRDAAAARRRPGGPSERT